MAFLGIKVPATTARLLAGLSLPGDRVPTSEMHITLLHFENNWEISEIIKALPTTYKVIQEIKPFLLKIPEITCFPSDSSIPIIAKVESPKLMKLRAKLAKAFDKAKIDYSKNFPDFKPHVTLSYAKKEIDSIEIDAIQFAVEELVIWCGDEGEDRLFITFPLQGPIMKKQAMLQQQVDIFHWGACRLDLSLQ